MNKYDELIDFLSEKGQLINDGFQLSVKEINNLPIQLYKNRLTKKNIIKSNANRQKKVLKIINYLFELSNLKKMNDDKINYYCIWNTFLSNRVDEIVKGNEKYNLDHPLFGYVAFYEKLIEFYSNKEEFEKCKELKQYCTNFH